MPRGGSKKGEHRGSARREAKRGGLPKGVSGNPKGKPKGSLNAATKQRLAAIAWELGTSELDGIMPNRAMLNIMRTFLKMAERDQADIEALGPNGNENRLFALTSAYERHIVLAGDMAYKAASYYHPRLQALMVGGAQDKSPGDVLREMLNEIDDESRVERQQARQIEHKPIEDAPATPLPLKAVNER